MMKRAIRWPLAILLVAWAGVVFAQAPDASVGPGRGGRAGDPALPGHRPGLGEVGLDRRSVTARGACRS